jgi:hypothetical protein
VYKLGVVIVVLHKHEVITEADPGGLQRFMFAVGVLCTCLGLSFCIDFVFGENGGV